VGSASPPPEPRYLPAEDTKLLRDALRSSSGEACLEIGFGSGALISSVSDRFGIAVGTDVIGLEQARLARGPLFDLVLADRATCFREGSFDLVFFNPPYVPSETVEDRAVDGGPSGIEVPLSFLEEATRVLVAEGTILMLLSDRGDLRRFAALCSSMALDVRKVAEEKLFYENLVVFRLEKEAGWRKRGSEAAKAKAEHVEMSER
jgi:release factor glutamine methyltransferase